MMIFVNECYKKVNIPKDYLINFLRLLNPIAPHLTEEINEKVFGAKKSMVYDTWPTYDPNKIKANEVTVVVQVNGKVRDKMEVESGLSKEKLEELALNNPKVKQYITGEVKKVIVVPNK